MCSARSPQVQRHAAARAALALALSLGAAFAVAFAAGCNNEDDEHLWGGDLSPTQMQKADMGPRPSGLLEINDGDSEDPFTDNPGFPYVEEPWENN